MSDVPMPRDLSEEAVAAFMREVCCLNVQRIPAAELRAWEHSSGKEGWRIVAAHVRALVERAVAEERASTREKVRGAVVFAQCGLDDEGRAIVARVMGDHPSNASGGHEAEGREVPRG